MVKKRRILYIILFILIIIIIKNFSIKSPNKENILKDIEYGMGNGTTTYKDFSDLKNLDTEYSYSSINYREDTTFVLLNRKQDGFTYTDDKTVGISGKRGFVLEIDNSKANPKILIKNCAVGENGVLLDVVVELSNYKAFKSSSNDRQYVQLATISNFTQETNQTKPIAFCDNDETTVTTQQKVRNQIGSPIIFNLHTYMAEVRYTMTYYVHPEDNVYPHNNSGVYFLDLNKMTKAGITKTNGFYYDLDIVNGWNNNSQSNVGNVTIFKR